MRLYHRIFTGLLVILIFNSCGALAESKAGYEIQLNQAIPLKFGEVEHILLVQLTGVRSFDKYIEKAAYEEYRGPIKFIWEETLNKPEIGDIEKYRFILKQNKNVATHFYMIDRVEDKIYSNPELHGSAYYRILKAYFRRLEEERLKE